MYNASGGKEKISEYKRMIEWLNKFGHGMSYAELIYSNQLIKTKVKGKQIQAYVNIRT